MTQTAVIFDCFTVEPSGLGVPPSLSPYVREAFSALAACFGPDNVYYLTVDDMRWALNGGKPFGQAPLTDPLTYSATVNRSNAITLLADAATVLVIAGDAVPSAHLQAQNGDPEDIVKSLARARGRRILLGPLSVDVLGAPDRYTGLFDAIHTHSVTADTIFKGSVKPPAYPAIAHERKTYEPLIRQIGWTPIAEIEMYRGCTRKIFCGFCNEPVKNREVVFREPADIIEEVALLYAAGVRNFRLGQQTCFFSYKNKDESEIERVLEGIRSACPELEVLHIDNADPLAVASNVGKRIAQLVSKYCTEGNCAPLGIESFDKVVINDNALTCTPEVAIRAIENINVAGRETGPLGFPKLLPGLNIIYGLPGETHRTHMENLGWLTRTLEMGLHCHRTNVRPARTYPGTPLAQNLSREERPSEKHFETWKADIAEIYDRPMKERVYPVGRRLKGMHSFFVTSRGTWHRRLGSYSIQVVERDMRRTLYQPTELVVTEHASRYIYGERIEPKRIETAA